ncbi:MAG TPA: molybdopterin-synthase adenylyltransferase MoeB [Devosiaceae bacterium]|jgi:molybdopterin/thiamine biosynthesis adenylyltransferase|nr:molybdopterin-synthase adenylyltransferase MoeB [Devosiaceae bacterium]
MPLTPDETRRYARQLVLKGVGGAGQQRLQAARVLVLGAGGLGSPVIAYLAAAGVGTLGVIDHDTVALSNLQRQIVHNTSAIDTPKADSAGSFVAALNPHVRFLPYHQRFEASTHTALLADYDLLIEGTDNFAARAAAAAAAEAAGKPLVSGAVTMFDGQLTVFLPGGPRFADLYPVPPDEADLPSCEMVGVLGAVTGVVGTLMAMEAIKLITGLGTPLAGRLLLYDGRAARFTELAYA